MMDSMYDYIKWMGGFSFSEYRFNELDALVMCLISYFDLSPACPDGQAAHAMRFGDCMNNTEKEDLILKISGSGAGYPESFEAAAASKRFGDLTVSDIVDIFDPSVPIQFSAMRFRCPEFNFIAIRGTDSSLAGWKEDFMISFTRTAAQEQAAIYCRQHIEPGKPNYIGGHSKGGNLSLYAACTLPDDALKELTRVFILDGPGLCPDVFDPAMIDRIDGRATMIIPEYDIIGKLFDPGITDTRIVRSSASGVLQHDLCSWGVEYGRLALTDSNDPKSSAINRTLDRWIESMDQSQRILLVNELFDVLGANGAVTLEDLEKEGARGLQSILTGFHEISDVTKQSLSDLRTRAVLGDNYDKWLELKDKQESLIRSAGEVIKRIKEPLLKKADS